MTVKTLYYSNDSTTPPILAMKGLWNYLRNEPWFIKVVRRGVTGRPVLVVYARDSGRRIREKVPESWCGYRVRVSKEKCLV